jgi:hypothetical protein
LLKLLDQLEALGYLSDKAVLIDEALNQPLAFGEKYKMILSDYEQFQDLKVRMLNKCMSHFLRDGELVAGSYHHFNDKKSNWCDQSRQHLIHDIRVSAGKSNSSIVFVTGRFGCGKSSVLSQLIASPQSPVVAPGERVIAVGHFFRRNSISSALELAVYSLTFIFFISSMIVC